MKELKPGQRVLAKMDYLEKKANILRTVERK